MQKQLVDFVVENAEASVLDSVPDHFDVTTAADGLADVWLPPGAEASVQCLGLAVPGGGPGGYEADDAERRIVVSCRREQFVAFELHETARLRVRLRDAAPGAAALAGAVVRFVQTEDERGERVHDGGAVTLETDASGTTAWFMGRAGALMRTELVSVPPGFLSIADLDCDVPQQQVVRLTGEHTLAWRVPRKPRVEVRVHDAASGERIIGVQFRVMGRPHAASEVQPRVSFGGAKLLGASVEVCKTSTIAQVHLETRWSSAEACAHELSHKCMLAQMARRRAAEPSASHLLEGDGMPHHIKEALEQNGLLSAVSLPDSSDVAQLVESLQAHGDAAPAATEASPEEPGTASALQAADSSSPQSAPESPSRRRRKSALKACSTQQEHRLWLSERRHDVKTWNGAKPSLYGPACKVLLACAL